MGKPSIFSNDYNRKMRRRKYIFRTVILVIALGAIFITYYSSDNLNLKRIAQESKTPSDNSIQTPKGADTGENTVTHDKTGDITSTQPDTAVKQENPGEEKGEFSFKFPNDESMYITYTKTEGDIKITGIRSDNPGVSFSIRDDGKAVAFDNPGLSDIWIYNIDGTSRKISPDLFREIGNEGVVYYKNDIMAEYDNSYTWAANPLFLKDGRIIYESNLPWFNSENRYYLWIIDSDGQNNTMLSNIGQTNKVKYMGFTEDGSLLAEMDGIKYAINTSDGSRQIIE